jgi:hypothetical protein
MNEQRTKKKVRAMSRKVKKKPKRHSLQPLHWRIIGAVFCTYLVWQASRATNPGVQVADITAGCVGFCGAFWMAAKKKRLGQ